MTAPANPYAAAARERKAAAIENVLLTHGWTADQAEAATLTERNSIARRAGVPEPSHETWALVVHLIRRAEG